ncbi:hypothetical protein [Nocardioides daejeonensis]|uniref:hypothetical protein n=1 Tax=Nocardioides daejeonensis TaxID=1046556 RepID=UPI0013A58D87|nr:hypothetical protein [Nocardioides daejeonensis]
MLLLLVAPLLMAVSGCPSEPGRDTTGVHRNGGGVLKSPEGITSSIYAPKQKHWTASWAAAEPCVAGNGPAVIDAIRYDFSVEPVSVRTVSFIAKNSRLSFGNAIGPPEELRDGHPQGVPGRVVGDVAGVEITNPCSKVPTKNIQQFITVMDVDERGAAIDSYYIDYHTDEGSYTLKADYRMIACGTETEPEDCDPDV